jgi:hypothetical protein
LACNLVYVFADPPWLRSLGGLLIAAVGVAVCVRLWQVFPFEFDDSGFDWAVVFRVLLVVGAVGSAVGVIVQSVAAVRAVLGGANPR